MARPEDIKKSKKMKRIPQAETSVEKFLNDNPNNISTAVAELKKEGYDAFDDMGVIMINLLEDVYKTSLESVMKKVKDICERSAFIGSFGFKVKR